MEKIILIIMAAINPAEKESLQIYLSGMNELYAKVGAKPVARYTLTRSLIGEENYNLVVVMEFPDQDALQTVFKSESYQKLLPHRERAFTRLHAFVSE